MPSKRLGAARQHRSSTRATEPSGTSRGCYVGQSERSLDSVSEALEAQAETLKLARLLDCDAERLIYLEEVPLDDLRALRQQITEVLFTAHEASMRRLATASKLLPVGLVANLGQHTFGPMLSARIAGLLDTDRAVDVATRMPTEFLADVACELDPRRASQDIWPQLVELFSGLEPPPMAAS